MILVTVEGFYDHTSQNNPVKYKFTRPHQVYLNFGRYIIKSLNLKQNRVKQLDGSIELFVSYENGIESNVVADSQFLSTFIFEMADNYDYYETYIDYQPVINSSLRNLQQDESSTRNLEQEESSSSKDLMSSEYFAFFVMAQMGGLYTFLKLVFGLFVHHFNTQSLNHNIMNSVYKFKHKIKTKHDCPNSNRHQDDVNDSHLAQEQDDQNNLLDKLKTQQIDSLFKNKKNNSKSRSKSNTENNHKNMMRQKSRRVQDYEGYQEYEGGDHVEYNQNEYDNSKSDYYDANDLLFSVFCCNKSKGKYNKNTKNGRNVKFNKHLSIFNKQRDLINIITSMNKMKTEIRILTDKIDQLHATNQVHNSQS